LHQSVEIDMQTEITGTPAPAGQAPRATGRSNFAGTVMFACLAMTGMGAPAAAQVAVPDILPGDALASMVGEWQGTGWSAMPDGSRESFDIFERVESIGGGNAIMIRGMGYAPAGQGRNGRLVHDAGGFVSIADGGYQMFAATARGAPESYPMTITETGYQWEITLGPQGRMVFEAWIEGDSWVETGQYCNPQGTCFPTLEMTLTRVAD
jgi:hypothetical protein